MFSTINQASKEYIMISFRYYKADFILYDVECRISKTDLPEHEPMWEVNYNQSQKNKNTVNKNTSQTVQ